MVNKSGDDYVLRFMFFDILGWLDMVGRDMAQAYLNCDKGKGGIPLLLLKWRAEFIHHSSDSSVCF